MPRDVWEKPLNSARKVREPWLGVAPRFQLVTLEALIAIDAFWSMQGFADRPFHALSIYRDVYLQGKRYDVPDVPMAPKADIQAVRWLHVGMDWDEGHLRIFTGLRDPILDGFAFPCMGPLKPLKDGKLVIDVHTAEFFTVDPEGATLLLDFELDRLLAIHDDSKRGLITKGFMTYVEYGTIALAKNQVGTVDRILRRTAWKERHGLTGPGYDLDSLMERTISDKEMRQILAGGADHGDSRTEQAPAVLDISVPVVDLPLSIMQYDLPLEQAA